MIAVATGVTPSKVELSVLTPPALQRIAFQAAAILMGFALPTIAAMMMDDRLLNGVSVWDKPLKFEVSLTVHLLTIGFLSRALDAARTASRLVRIVYVTSAVSAIGEVAYIVLQAARGRQSHFNFDTPLESIMYGMMGVGATALVVCAFIIGLGILKSRKPGIGEGFKEGAAWGLMLGAVATFITAGVMSSGLLAGAGHWVGGVHSDAQGLPLTGWSTTGGDLRVAHFFATHLMQTLPLAGYCADRWLPGQARPVVWIVAAFIVMVVVATFVQAAEGQPLHL